MNFKLIRLAEEKEEDKKQEENQEESENKEVEEDVVDDRDIEQENPNSLENMVMGDDFNTNPMNSSINDFNNEELENLETQLQQIADYGKKVMQDIEKFQLFINDMARGMKNNEALANKITEKSSNIEEFAVKFSKFIFEMENPKLLEEYQNPLMGIDDSNELDGLVGYSPSFEGSEEEEEDESKDNEEEVVDDRDNEENSEDESNDEFETPNDLLDALGDEGFEELMGLSEDDEEEKPPK